MIIYEYHFFLLSCGLLSYASIYFVLLFFILQDQVSPFVSSIFLRRLLLPGVHQNIVLRTTLQDYNKHMTDSEFYSLTVDGLKKEILSLIEHEV